MITKHLRVLVGTGLLALLLAVLFSCGRGKAPSQSSVLSPQSSDNGVAPPSSHLWVAPPFQAATPRKTTVDEALAELQALETPAGVDEALFCELKAALRDALLEAVGARHAVPLREKKTAGHKTPPYKLVSKPPTGPSNRVNDLELVDNGDGTFTLTWSYRNVGDFNQDSIVNISDITPLAVHFNEEADETNEWIDGNADGVINIMDITPLAANFMTDCAGYKVQGWAEAGLWEEVNSVPFSFALGAAERLRFEYDLDVLSHGFYRVVPYDATSAEGARSVIAPQTPTLPPNVVEVSPRSGTSGEPITFSAWVEGSEPLSYSWDFGGGADPDESTEASPTVTMGDEGTYSVSLTVTNALGSDTFSFTLTVDVAGTPPTINLVSPRSGITGREITFTAEVSGDRPLSYSWDFGGGATPNARSGASPTVLLGAPGAYDAVLEVTNAYGGDTYPFTLTVAESGVITEWVRTWGGAGSDVANALALDGAGVVYVAGWTESFGAEEDDLLLLKYDSDGKLLWRKTWGTSGWDEAYAIALDGTGGIYVAGQTDDVVPPYWEQVLLLKYDAAGNLIWQRTWGAEYGDFGCAMALDGSGNIYVAGQTEQPIDGSGEVDHALLLKYDADGNLLWQKSWARAGMYAIALGGDGSIYLVGDTVRSGGWDLEFLLLKYDSEGNPVWQKTWGGSDDEIAAAVAVDATGNVYVTGGTYSFGAGELPDLVIIKYDSEGHLVWQRTWCGSFADAASSIALDEQGNVYVAGVTGDPDSFLDLLLLKCDPTGDVLWHKTWIGYDVSFAHSVLLDGSMDLYIAGASHNAYGYWDNLSGEQLSPQGEDETPAGAEATPEGDEGTPAGEEASPDGVENEGGGGNDFLLMKCRSL